MAIKCVKEQTHLFNVELPQALSTDSHFNSSPVTDLRLLSLFLLWLRLLFFLLASPPAVLPLVPLVPLVLLSVPPVVLAPLPGSSFFISFLCCSS